MAVVYWLLLWIAWGLICAGIGYSAGMCRGRSEPISEAHFRRLTRCD